MALKPAAAASALAVVLLVCAAVLYTHDVALEAEEVLDGRYASYEGVDAQVRTAHGNRGNEPWGGRTDRRLAPNGPPHERDQRGERGGGSGRRNFLPKRAELQRVMQPMVKACAEEAKALPCPVFHAALAESSGVETQPDVSLARSWDAPAKEAPSMPVALALAVCLDGHKENLSEPCLAAYRDAPIPSRSVVTVLNKCLPTAPTACRTYYGRGWYAEAGAASDAPDAFATGGAGDGRALKEDAASAFTLDDALRVVDAGDSVHSSSEERDHDDGEGDGDGDGDGDGRRHRGRKHKKGKKWHKRQSGGKERHREGRRKHKGKHKRGKPGKGQRRKEKWQHEALDAWREGAEKGARPGGAEPTAPQRGLEGGVEGAGGLEWVKVDQDKPVVDVPSPSDESRADTDHGDVDAPPRDGGEEHDAAHEGEDEGADGDRAHRHSRRRHRKHGKHERQPKHGKRERHGKRDRDHEDRHRDEEHRRSDRPHGKSRGLMSKAHKPMLAGAAPTVRVGPVDGHEGGPRLDHTRVASGGAAATGPTRAFMPEARGGDPRGDGHRNRKFKGPGGRRGGKGRGGRGGRGGDRQGVPQDTGDEDTGDLSSSRDNERAGGEHRGRFDKKKHGMGGKRGFKPSKFVKCLRKRHDELEPPCRAAVDELTLQWKQGKGPGARHMEERSRGPRGGGERDLKRSHGHKQAAAPHSRHGHAHRRPARKMLQPAAIAGIMAGAAFVILAVVVAAVCIRRARRSGAPGRNGFTQMQPVRATAGAGSAGGSFATSSGPPPSGGVSRRAANAAQRSTSSDLGHAGTRKDDSHVDPPPSTSPVDAHVIATPV